MRPIPTRLATLVSILVLALGTAACARGSGDETATSPSPTPPPATGAAPSTTPSVPSGTQTVAVTVTGGTPEGGVQHVHVSLGTPVELTVTADVSDEVHVHGFDLHADVSPDQPATITFTADQPGDFEVELEQHATTLVVLEVGA